MKQRILQEVPAKLNYVEILKQYLVHIYDENSFVRLLDLKIEDVREGEAVMTMPVDPAKHTNLYQVAHGGAVASIADTVMGVACATFGKRVVTIDMNINFLRSAEKNQLLRAAAKVIHNGRQTMVAEVEILDSEGNLTAKSRGTFMVVGTFEAMKKDD